MCTALTFAVSTQLGNGASGLGILTSEAFPWGDLLQQYEVGPYVILEFHPWQMCDYKLLVGQVDWSKLKYRGFVNGEDLAKAYDNLDAALVACIAYRHEGASSQAARYFLRMIDDYK
jgi:hypothetical protein